MRTISKARQYQMAREADPDLEVSLETLADLIKTFELRFEALSLLNLRFTVSEAKRAGFSALDIDMMKSRLGALLLVDGLEASSFTDGFAIVKSSALVQVLAADLMMVTAVQKLGATLPSTLLGRLSSSRQQELLNLGLVGNATGMAHLDDRSTTPQLGDQSGAASFGFAFNATFAEKSGVHRPILNNDSFFPFDEGEVGGAEPDFDSQDAVGTLVPSASGIHRPQSGSGDLNGVSGLGFPMRSNDRKSVSGMGFHREKSGSVLGIRPNQGEDERSERNDTSGLGPHTPSIDETREFLKETCSYIKEHPSKALGPKKARKPLTMRVQAALPRKR